MFSYLTKILFSGFLQFKGNFVRGQNRDWAPLTCVICNIVFGVIFTWAKLNQKRAPPCKRGLTYEPLNTTRTLFLGNYFVLQYMYVCSSECKESIVLGKYWVIGFCNRAGGFSVSLAAAPWASEAVCGNANYRTTCTMGFINAFSGKAAGFHRQAKRF